MKDFRTPCFRTRQTRRMQKRSAWTCALAVFLTFSYAHEVAAQTTYFESSTSTASAAIPKNVESLEGAFIDYEHYKDYVSTGRPEDDPSKIFLFYNVGTGKFLNVGSYWGTHAVLSDVPRLFWLQRRNEQYVLNQWTYLRYPEAFAEKGTFAYDFFTLNKYQVGAKQGDKLSYVKYNYVRLVNTSDNTYESLCTEGMQGTGSAIDMKDSQSIDFNSQRIEAEIDLANVKETYDHGTQGGSDGKVENILSLGSDISEWKSDGSVTDLHFYASKTSAGIYEITVDCLSKDWKEVTHKKVVQISNGSIAKIVISKGSITVNGKECRPGSVSDDYESPIKPFLAQTQLQVGSEEGKTRTNAQYNYVKKVNPNYGQTTKTTKIWEDNYESNGMIEAQKVSNINFGIGKIKAVLNFSDCGTDNKDYNVFSIGTGIEKFGNPTKNDPNIDVHNIHVYFNGNNNTVLIYAEDKKVGSWDQYKWTMTVDKNTNHTIELSNKGLYFDDSLIWDTSNRIVKDVTTTYQDELSIGACEGTNYSKVKYVSTEFAETAKEDALIEAGKTGDGQTKFASEKFDIDFSNGEYIEAEIDLANCKLKNENILSIGTDIDKWGQNDAKNAHNLHIYLRKNDWSDNNLYVAYVNKDHSDDLKRVFTVKKDENGKAILRLKLSQEGLTINGKDMYPAIDPMPTVPYSREKAGDIVRFEQYDGGDNIFKIDENGKYIIAADNDMNAHGMNVSSNGYLYTKESRTDQVFPLFISSQYLQDSTDTKNQGSFLAWAPHLTNNERWGACGLFADRDLPQEELDATTSFNASQWFFKKVDGQNSNVYEIYLKMDSVDVPYRTGVVGSKKDESYNYDKKSGCFYLQATSEQVYSNQLEDYGGGINTNTSTATTRLTEVDALNAKPAKPELGYWKIINIEDYYELFKAANTEMSQMLDITFMLGDPNFSRLSNQLKSWKMDDDLAGKVRFGYDNYSKKSTTENEYTKDDGTTTKANDQNASNHARYCGVDVKNGKGKICNTVELENAGWYAIKCGGVSTVDANLFAQFNNEVVHQPLHRLTKKEYAALNQTSGLVWPYENNMPMYNALVAMNDSLASKDGSEVYKKYNNQIVFFVDPDVLKSNGGKITVTFGIDIPTSGGNIDLLSTEGRNATSSDEDYETSQEWTVFDNFHLLFGGNDGEPYLILDEDDSNVDHLDKTIHKYRSGVVDDKTINKKLYLNRTFSPNKWNTIMLPVGLNKEQFTKAFGEDASLAELYKLTEEDIQFKTVSSESMYEDGKYDNNAKYWLKPMTPYIIKTSKTHGDNTEAYTAHLYTWASNGSNYIEKTIGSQEKPCFVIDNINMVEGIVKSENNIESTFGSHWNFKGMTISDGNDGEYPYVMKGQVADQNGTMIAYGHLAQNFKMSTDGKRQLIEGRAPMADSYTLSGNKLTYILKGAASKGFRCWFQYTRPHDSSNEAKMTLDGVEMTTGIDNIMANDEGIYLIDRFSNGVYNINGQLVRRNTTSMEGLPKGIYIVNGKKIVKD